MTPKKHQFYNRCRLDSMKRLLTILCLALLASCSSDYQITGFDEGGDLLSDRYIVENGLVFQVNSQTPFTGSFGVYHNNGSLDRIPNYKDGILNGPWEAYHENGQLREKGDYKDGQKDGLFEEFDDNGN